MPDAKLAQSLPPQLEYSNSPRKAMMISSAGSSWCRLHRIDARRLFLCARCDEPFLERFRQDHPSDVWWTHDHIELRKRNWLLESRYERMTYCENLTKRATLTIADERLPENLSISLYRSGIRLLDVVSLPPEWAVRDADGKIIRATNLPNGDLELLLWIDWQDIATAHLGVRPSRVT